MNGKLRRLGAILALLALSFSAVETGWAACVDAAPVSPYATEAAGAPHSQHDPPVDDNQSNGDAGTEEYSCPMAVSSGMACGVLVVSPPITSTIFSVEVSNILRPVLDRPIGSGAISSLFRPPQQ